MHKIGDMPKLHIDGGSDLGCRGLWKAGVPQGGSRIKAGGVEGIGADKCKLIFLTSP